MSSQFRPLFALLVAALIGSGCGQKGALYLPNDPSEMQTLEPVGAAPVLAPESGSSAEDVGAAVDDASENEISEIEDPDDDEDEKPSSPNESPTEGDAP